MPTRHAHPAKLICEPFPTVAAETKVSHAFAQTSQKVEATRLKVLVGHEFLFGVEGQGNKIPSGATVYVAGEDCRSIWGRKILSMPGTDTRFVVVPVDAVLFWETGD